MVDYLPRSAWNARPPTPGPGSLTVSRVEGVAIHWPGTTSHTPILSLAAVASALRGWQDYHMDVRGWSDIAYQVAVDQAGRAWTLRGLRTQSGANGNTDLNERYGAILLVLVQDEAPSLAMKATTRAVVADFRVMYPAGVKVVGHRDIRPGGTDCPGPAAYAALINGDFTPTTIQEDDMSAQDVADGIRMYMRDFFKDEQGTGDTIWDESRSNAANLLAAISTASDEAVLAAVQALGAKLDAQTDAIRELAAALTPKA